VHKIFLELLLGFNHLTTIKKLISNLFLTLIFYFSLLLQLFIETLLYFFFFKKILNLKNLYFYKKKKIRNKLLNHLRNSILYVKYNCLYEEIENNLFFLTRNYKFLSRKTPIISFLVSIVRKNNNYLDKRKNSLFNLLIKKKYIHQKKLLKILSYLKKIILIFIR